MDRNNTVDNLFRSLLLLITISLIATIAGRVLELFLSVRTAQYGVGMLAGLALVHYNVFGMSEKDKK